MPTRAEHRRTTLLVLSEAAISLFEEQGASATVEAIAERAGVARRTVFRYIDVKEELAFIHPVIWFDVFDNALAEVADEQLVDKFRIASGAIAAYIDTDPAAPKRAFIVTMTNPELAKGFNSIYQRWIERVATEVLTDRTEGAEPTPTDRFHARIMGAAVMGMVDATVREWMFSPPDVTFSELYEDGFEILAPLFDQLAENPKGSGT